MTTRIFVPLFLLVGATAFVVAAEDARAAPLAPAAGKTAVAFGPRIRVGVGVTVPVGRRVVHRHHPRPHYREVVEYVGGYYETRTREVRVPGRQIGWDMHGHPLYGPERIEVQEYRVWIPRRRVVRTVRVRHGHGLAHGHHHVVRPRGYVTVGGSVRVR